MRTKLLIGCLIFVSSTKILAFSEDDVSIRIDGLSLSPNAYGFFHSGPHFFQNQSKNTHVNFNYRAALWVGAVTPETGKTVTSGDGNERTSEPEWRPFPKLNTLAEQPVFSKIRETEYGDAFEVLGHVPLDLAVLQEVYHAKKQAFTILRFKIFSLRSSTLSGVYLSFINDVDIPTAENKFERGKNHFGVTEDGGTAFVYRTQGNNKKRDVLGVTALNIENPAIFTATNDLSQFADSARYDLMTQRQTEGFADLQDYSFGVGGGEFQLSPGDTLVFDLAIVYGKDEKKFLDHIAEAKSVYQQVLPPAVLLKQANVLVRRSPDAQTPERFQLFQSYPNPTAGPRNTISFQLPAESRISLVVYNTLGQQVAVILDNESRAFGLHKIAWNANGADDALLPPGVYFYRLTAFQNNKAVYHATQKTIITY